MEPYWRIKLFGGLQLIRGEEIVTHFPRERTAMLLAYLASPPGQAHPRTRLSDLLWPDKDDSTGLMNLRTSLSVLRKVLEPEGIPNGAVLFADRQLVKLNAGAVITDIAEWEAALKATALAGDPAERVRRLARAVDLYGGELLTGYYASWIQVEQQRLMALYLDALEALIAFHEQNRNLETAIHYADRALQVDIENEEIFRKKMYLYAAAGQPLIALQQYEQLKHRLRHEMQTEPSAETQAAAQRILRLVSTSRHDGSLRDRAALPSHSAPLAGMVSTGGHSSLASAVCAACDQSFLAHSSKEAPPELENRVVTLLVFRLSGRSGRSLAMVDQETRTLAIRAVADILIRYEGQPGETQEDHLIAVFGASCLHEDDPERAILAALEIRQALDSLNLSVSSAISTGRIGAGEENSGFFSQEESLSPDALLEQAARILLNAAPGQVLIAASTYRHTRHAFHFLPPSVSPARASLPPGALSFHIVESRRYPPQKARGIEGLRSDMVGRDTEFARLRKLYSHIQNGQGQIVSIIGEAGVGKSRLVSELKRVVFQQAQAQGQKGPLWLEGRGLELRAAASYGLAADILRGLFSTDTDKDEGAQAERLKRSLDTLRTQGALSRERCQEMFPFLANLLSLPLSQTDHARLNTLRPEGIKHQTFTSIRDYLFSLSRQRPLVLIYEDLHWADAISIDLIGVLMELCRTSRICLICIYRPDPDHRCSRLGLMAAQKYPEQYTEMPLKELSSWESSRLIKSLLRMEEVPPSLKDQVLDRGRGNPFFIEELIRSLIDEDVIYREAQQWLVRDTIESRRLPEGIQSVMLARIDQLPQEQRHLLQIASVMGRLFRKRVLEHLAPDSLDLEGALWDLEGHTLIYQDRVVPEEEYSFKHVLTQGAVYRSMAPSRRVQIHSRVAEAIELIYSDRTDEFCGELAHHHLVSGAHRKAVDYLLTAGRRALRMYANQEAIAYFEQALDAIQHLSPAEKDLDLEINAMEGMGDAFFTTGAHSQAEVQLQRAMDLSQQHDQRRSAVLAAKLADAVHWQGQPDRAIRIALHCLERPHVDPALRADLGPQERATLLEVITRSFVSLGDEDSARYYAGQLRHAISRAPYFDTIYNIYYNLAWNEIRTRKFDAAREWLVEMERICLEHQNENGLARCYHGFGDLERALGDYQKACTWFLKSLAYCQRTGDSHFLLEGHLELAHALIVSGASSNQIEEHIQPGIRIAEEMAHSHPAPSVQTLCNMLGFAYSEKGDYDKAIFYYERALELGAHGNPVGDLRRLQQLCVQEDRYQEFLDFCARTEGQWSYPEPLPSGFWRLHPGGVCPDFSQLICEDFFDGPDLSPEWQWVDPGGKSSLRIMPGGGLELQTSEGHSMALGCAPRLLRPVSGDFAAEAHLSNIMQNECAGAGLILMVSQDNCLFLGKNYLIDNEIGLQVRREGCPRFIHLGWLPGSQIFLRLEKKGSEVTAFCSSDGQDWQLSGEAPFQADAPLWIGLFVSCPATIPVSTARFKYFRLLIPEEK